MVQHLEWLSVVLWIFIQTHQTLQVNLVNVAFKKPVTQRDAAWNGYSDRANDGNASPNYYDNSCTFSGSTSNAWWLVDLQRSYHIHHINITNRDEWPERLNNFYIYVSNYSPYPKLINEGVKTGDVCTFQSGALAAGGPHTLKCDDPDTRARYLYVWKAAERLTLCEFEVYSDPTSADLRFSVLPEKKSNMAPFSTHTNTRFTIVGCLAKCLSLGEKYATVAQLETTTKKCECIEANGIYSTLSEVPAEGWTVMTSLN